MAAEGVPWRCSWRLRLNRVNALRCGTCDYTWHQCIDHKYVHGARQAQPTNQDATNWNAKEEKWGRQRKSSASPRTRNQRGSTPKGKKDKQTSAPSYDPPWKAKQEPVSPSGAARSSSRAEEKIQILVAALQRSDKEQSPEVQQIMEETLVVEVTSQSMRKALNKVDVARSKFKAAQKARKNLHNNWMKYIEKSVKRWRTFAEDFATKDQALAAQVDKTKEALQTARQRLDDIKEMHSKQDEDLLKSDVEVVSDMEEEPDKMEDPMVIQEGISTRISSLDNTLSLQN